MGILGKITQLIQVFQDWFQKLTSGQKRQLAIVCTGVFALLLTLSVIISLTNKSEKEEAAEANRYMINLFDQNLPIPATELFLPDEPDFVPGVILERERRTSWTEEDAAEYWQDPLRFGEEQWREKIEAAIDNYLERIP